MVRSIKALDQVEEQTKGSEYFETLIRYIMHVRDDLHITELFEMAKEISIERRNVIMSIAEQLKKEGIEKGIEKGKAELVRKMINNGLSMDLVQKYTGIPVNMLQKILNDLEEKER